MMISALPIRALLDRPAFAGRKGDRNLNLMLRARAESSEHAAAPPPAQPISRRHIVHAAGAALALAGSRTARAATTTAPPPPPLPLILPERGSNVAARLAGLEAAVEEFTLPNGLTFLVLRRPAAPVISCHTYCRAGAWVEQEGQTGIAHLLEHLAFKGTARTGSAGWAREAPLLNAADEAFYELRDARSTGAPAATLARLEASFAAARAAADAASVPNAFGSRLSDAGAVGLNAATSHDCTRYYCSLPSNALELWLALEAERFRAPVFRQLYAEKEVVAEERRARLDNSPSGRWAAAYAAAALGNAYARPVIGEAADVAALGRREVASFYERYYHPENLIISIVGDADAERVRALAERHFGGWAASSLAGAELLPRDARAAAAAEPSARPRGVVPRAPFRAASPVGPAVALGYYRPSLATDDGIVLEAAADVLAGGRSSRLLRRLVQPQRLLSASVSPGYPGQLHAGLALAQAVPRAGGSLDAAARLLQEQLDDLAASGPYAAELDRVKRAARVSLLSGLQSNAGMAATLAAYHASAAPEQGGWRSLLRELEVVDATGSDDVRRVAGDVFAPGNRFDGYALRG